MEEYFFVAVSNEENLRLCIEWATAGFPETINGVWAYCDIKIGDFLTFLYGAKAYNLYRVVRKEAVKNPGSLPPPWKPIYFRKTGRTCQFPFRLRLEPIRKIKESLTRPEFSYIAENLLQRGGYWKTHFQADCTTLEQISKMGGVDTEKPRTETGTPELFEPKFVRGRKRMEGTYPLREVILQSVLRQHLLHPENLKRLLNHLDIEWEELEVLGEKALPEGYVDILLKRPHPRGENMMVAIEVKLGPGTGKDIEQLERYMKELGRECKAGVLLAERIPKRIHPPEGIHLVRYSFSTSLSVPHTFDELLDSVRLEL